MQFSLIFVRPGVPNLGYMYPQVCISLSEGVHLRFVIEGKSVFMCYLFTNIYTYINEYYFRKSLSKLIIVKYIRE